MKTWTLVWFLVFPPTDDGKNTWEYSREINLTMEQCFAKLADKDDQYNTDALDGKIVGHEIYCKDERGTPIPIEQRN